MKKLLLVLSISSLFINVFSQQTQYEYLVFEGAGIKGLAYSGVIRELENAGMMDQFTKVGGTSAGAITALAVSLGYSADEIYEIISETKFQKFNDPGFSRLKKSFGFYKGDKFIEWLDGIILNKTNNVNITFSELVNEGFKDLYITATCLNKQKLIVFSAENYPNMRIKDAVRISASIPFYFEAVYIDNEGKVYRKPKKEQNLDIVVDGGIIGNFPIFMFDSVYVDENNREIRIPNPKTIGVRIDTDRQIAQDSKDPELVPMEIEKLSDYIEAFYVLVLENLNRNILIPEDWDRTISVSSVGIGPRIKKLSPEQKLSLIRSGERYTRDFLERDLKR